MSHYFIEDKSLKPDVRQVIYYYKNHELTFTTDAGVFSKGHIDPATDILLRAVPPLSGSLLDMGCGYGCIGIALAKANGVRLTQADVNPAAVELTKANAKRNGVESEVILSDCFGGVAGTFDTIVINPPIHAGKSVTYAMYEQSCERLNAGGALYIVTLKKHGAESTQAKLTDIFGNCETLYKKKGTFVFRCIKA